MGLLQIRLRIGCSTPELLWQVRVLLNPNSRGRYGADPSNDLTAGVPWSGLEPLCLTAPPPQDGVSTNFTTRATSLRSPQITASRLLLSNSKKYRADGARPRYLSSDSRVL